MAAHEHLVQEQPLADVESKPVDTNPSNVMLQEDDSQETSSAPEVIIISDNEDNQEAMELEQQEQILQNKIKTFPRK